MSKKDQLLQMDPEYKLTPAETNHLNAVIEMINQARMAQDLLYTNLIQTVAARYEVPVEKVRINIEEVMEQGAEAKLTIS